MTWRYLKIMLALAADLSTLLLLGQGNDFANLATYFVLHALTTIPLTWMAWTLLPEGYRTPARPAYAMIYAFAFFIPVLGAWVIVLTLLVAQRYPKILRTDRYVTVNMPEFSEMQREATQRTDLRVGDARRILKDPSHPLETRLRVLVALQSMRPKATVPLLQSLLGDPSEDIRLLAYSMVEAWANDLAQQILAAMHSLKEAREGDERAPLVNALQRLAELHWQQVDIGLVRGDLRLFALEQAQNCCEDVLSLDGYVPSVWQLYARILLELDQVSAAARALRLARKVHMPVQEIWPLMAQIAYQQRDLDGVRKYMGSLPENAHLPHQLRGLASFWRDRQVTRLDLYV